MEQHNKRQGLCRVTGNRRFEPRVRVLSLLAENIRLITIHCCLLTRSEYCKLRRRIYEPSLALRTARKGVN